MPSIDHLTVTVRDLDRSKPFYTAALAPLGIVPVAEYGRSCGFGYPGKPDVWIAEGPASFQQPSHCVAPTPIHLALVARSRAEVDAFHAAALAAGGKDFGPPGERPEYRPGYYGAFVLDPDGHNIEAVHHGH